MNILKRVAAAVAIVAGLAVLPLSGLVPITTHSVTGGTTNLDWY